MNVEHLSKVIAIMERLPPDRVDMSNYANGVLGDQACGTAGCIAGWALVAKNGRFDPSEGDPSNDATVDAAAKYLGIYSHDYMFYRGLFCPDEYTKTARYPAHRVIATLKRLRDTYLSTGQVVVDWGPEPGEEPKTPWVAPHIAEVIAPTLPAEITSLLRQSLAKTEA